jgi:iron complex outermembrane receptor protein
VKKDAINGSGATEESAPMKKTERGFVPEYIQKYRRKRMAKILTAMAAVTMFSGYAAEDAPATTHPTGSTGVRNGADVMDLDLEQLMNLTVTSPSRKSERLSDAASAIFVITQEDIRRSGVTSIPEALRLSPGLEVARQDSHTWAISSRGFNDEFASKLLVLVDGRTVYTPLVASVNWDVQDYPLEDIDRIEVIRGPGASVWGANAVNGVINITTKSAKETQGLLITGGGGTEDQGFGNLRYGGKIGENAYYRVYGKYSNRDSSELRGGGDANDSWWMSRGGFRLDWNPNEKNLFTLQGDIYTGELGQTINVPLVTPPFGASLTDDVDTTGGNILGRWTHDFSADSELALKLYYDNQDRDRIVYAEKRHTFDFDLQHRFLLGERNDIVWGFGYNVTSDSLNNTPYVSFDPADRTTVVYSAFLQDEITLIEDRLRLTLGSKIEHNDYTGWEVQPSGRLSLNITDKQTSWFAVSRAVSTPARAEADMTLNRYLFPTGSTPPGSPGPVPAPVLLSLTGSDEMDAKELIAFEWGYRIQPHQRVTFDLATFYNIYDKERSLEAGAPDMSNFPGYIVQPYGINNLIDGETYGFELASTWQATDWWRIRANYTFWKLNLHKEEGSTDPLNEAAENDSPEHQIGIRSLMDLPHNLEFDTGLRYVSSLDMRRRFVAAPGEDLDIPGYVVGDVRIGWRPNYNWEVSIVGQNMFDKEHQEFAPSFLGTQETLVETSVYGKVTFRY